MSEKKTERKPIKLRSFIVLPNAIVKTTTRHTNLTWQAKQSHYCVSFYQNSDITTAADCWTLLAPNSNSNTVPKPLHRSNITLQSRSQHFVSLILLLQPRYCSTAWMTRLFVFSLFFPLNVFTTTTRLLRVKSSAMHQTQPGHCDKPRLQSVPECVCLLRQKVLNRCRSEPLRMGQMTSPARFFMLFFPYFFWLNLTFGHLDMAKHFLLHQFQSILFDPDEIFIGYCFFWYRNISSIGKDGVFNIFGNVQKEVFYFDCSSTTWMGRR